MVTYWLMMSLMSMHLVIKLSKGQAGGLQIVNNTGEAQDTCLKEHAWCQRGLPPYCCDGDQFCKKKEGMLWFWCEKKQSEKDYECGKVKQNTRIFGGNKTCDGCIPWVVLVDVKGLGACGGTIIGPKFVMTAAHCTFNRTLGQIIPAEKYTVVAGVTDYKDKEAIIRKVQKVHKHPNYDSQRSIYDFSILELTKPIDIGEGSKAGAVCLPEKSDMAKFEDGETTLLTSGWGFGNDPENLLQHAYVPWISHSTCKKNLLGIIYKDLKLKKDKETKKEIAEHGGKNKWADWKIGGQSVTCAGDLSNDDWKTSPVGCRGDSGGPWTWEDPKTSKVKLMAVTSYSFKGNTKKLCKGKYEIPDRWIGKEDGSIWCCIPVFYQGLSKITHVLDWIKEVINEFRTDTTLKKIGDKENNPTAPRNSVRNFSPAPVGLQGSLYFVP